MGNVLCCCWRHEMLWELRAWRFFIHTNKEIEAGKVRKVSAAEVWRSTSPHARSLHTFFCPASPVDERGLEQCASHGLHLSNMGGGLRTNLTDSCVCLNLFSHEDLLLSVRSLIWRLPPDFSLVLLIFTSEGRITSYTHEHNPTIFDLRINVNKRLLK